MIGGAKGSKEETLEDEVENKKCDCETKRG